MPSLTQQETALRSAVYKGFYHIASTNPTVNDDKNKSFIFGSRWLKTTLSSQEEFVCISNEPGAAVWLSTTSGGGSGGGIDPHIATVDPVVGDDTLDGYVIGQLWLNTVLETCFIAMSVSTGAAVWVELTGGGSGGGIAPHIDTVDPTVGDDNLDGYVAGQVWVNTTTPSVFVAISVATGAAVWLDVSTASGGASSSTTPETIGAIAIASARMAVAHTPQLLYDGFADGCLDLDGVNTGTTTYVVSGGTLANKGTPTEVRASGTVSASTEYSAGYDATKAVDGSDATRWSSSSTGANWFKIDFGVGVTKRIASIVIKRSQYDGGWTPVVERSSDGSSWTTEYTHSALANGPTDNTSVTLSFTPSGAYRYWRVSGTWTAQNATWNDYKIYEETIVSAPIYESASRAMPYRPIKATVVIAAYINTLTLNTNFVAKYSSNGGTDYETFTLTELCAAPYATDVKLYIGTITTVDRGTQACRIKIEGGSVLHNIYGIALVGQPEAASGGSAVVVDDLALDMAITNLQQATVTQQLLRGDVLVGVDLTGLLGGADTTFLSAENSYVAAGFSAPGGTNVLSGTTLTRSVGGTTTAATNGNTADYDQMTTTVPLWWQVDFGSGVTKIISKVRINQYYDGNNSIAGFKIQGSNDNSSWTDTYIGTMTNVHNSFVDFTFTPLVSTAFRYYRFYVTSRAGAQASCTLFELEFYESTYVSITDPILTSVSHVLPDEPAKVAIALVVDLDSFTLNSTFVASISNNGGTNYDTVTLVDRGSLLPYVSPYIVCTAVATLTDRNSQTMRIKIQCTGTGECIIKAIAVQYIK